MPRRDEEDFEGALASACGGGGGGGGGKTLAAFLSVPPLVTPRSAILLPAAADLAPPHNRKIFM